MAETFQLDIIAPDKSLLSGAVTMAVIPGSEGDFGVLPRHAPVISQIRPGIITIQGLSGNSSGGGDLKLFISGGFVSVENNSCIILADYAKPLSEIKRDEVVSRIEKIKSDLNALGAEQQKSRQDSKQNELANELKICEAMLAVASEQK